MEFGALEKEALGLKADLRAKLASRLLESLDEVAEDEAAELWVTESERRDREWDEPGLKGIPLELALSEARKRVR